MKKTKYILMISSLILFIAIGSVLFFSSENNSVYVLDKPYYVEKITGTHKKDDKPKNIIFLVGDGMSLSVMYTAWTANRGYLNIDNCENIGLSKTYSADNLITDSAAGATAFATGHKTKNHNLSVDENGSFRRTIMEIAKSKGLSTGVIGTCNILDATPSSFVSHVNNRDNWNTIALQYLESDIDFVCGGGWKNFASWNNQKDLTKDLVQKGYAIPRTIEQLEKIDSGKVFSLLADDSLPDAELRGNTLSKASLKAIDILSKNPNGFFLMIEGSMIDDKAHENNLKLMMEEMLDFDRTIGQVLKWAADDGETLVIITADHETGGWTLLGGDKNKGKVEGKFSTDDHSGVMVPVYSFGPSSNIFSGIFENTDIFYKIFTAFGFNSKELEL